MVLMAEPILRAVSAIMEHGTWNKKKAKVVVLSAKGRQFNQKMAYDWAKKYAQIIFVSGRYEGIDERVAKILRAEEVSIGPFVLTDGDVAAMVMVSAVARLVPGVIKLESLQEESHTAANSKEYIANGKKVISSKPLAISQLEYPHYTRPEVLEWKGRKYRVPKVLLSGNHKEISEWRSKHRA